MNPSPGKPIVGRSLGNTRTTLGKPKLFISMRSERSRFEVTSEAARNGRHAENVEDLKSKTDLK